MHEKEQKYLLNCHLNVIVFAIQWTLEVFKLNLLFLSMPKGCNFLLLSIYANVICALTLAQGIGIYSKKAPQR